MNDAALPGPETDGDADAGAVFAYGSNMHLSDLRRWLAAHGHRTDGILGAIPALLPGYRLVWHYYSSARRGGAASIAAAETGALPGVVLTCDADTFAAIARKEGFPTRYHRFRVTVRPLATAPGGLDGAPLPVWVYQVRPEYRQEETVPPTPGYLALLIQAAESFRLPDRHIQELKKTPTKS